MKDRILDILGEHINISTNRVEPLVDELTALMCYREVRAFLSAIEYVNASLSADEVIDCFVPEYEREQIIQAVEQVKKEMK